jgi:hypothetical protein
MLLNPKRNEYEHLDARSREIMLKTIEFFETEGKQRLKQDHNERVWYIDFLNFFKENSLTAMKLIAARADGPMHADDKKACGQPRKVPGGMAKLCPSVERHL